MAFVPKSICKIYSAFYVAFGVMASSSLSDFSFHVRPRFVSLILNKETILPAFASIFSRRFAFVLVTIHTHFLHQTTLIPGEQNMPSFQQFDGWIICLTIYNNLNLSIMPHKKEICCHEINHRLAQIFLINMLKLTESEDNDLGYTKLFKGKRFVVYAKL